MKRSEIKNKKITLVEYLQSNSDATILNGGPVIPTYIQSYKLETTITLQEVEYSQNTDEVQLAVGCWNTNNNRYYAVQHTSVNKTSLCSASKNNNIINLCPTDLNTVHTIVYNDDSNNVYLDGVYKTRVSDITIQNLANTIGLFGAHSNDGNVRY